VAATGVHGANRLASNSLLEGLVFGARAAQAMLEDGHPLPSAAAAADVAGPAAGWPERAELQARAWEGLGLERDAAGLRALLDWLEAPRPEVEALRGRAGAEARNLADVARAMGRCALFREESRGGHFRSDFPERDERFLGHTWLDASGARLADVDVPLPARAQC
jgi:L-aspartate oxidase